MTRKEEREKKDSIRACIEQVYNSLTHEGAVCLAGIAFVKELDELLARAKHGVDTFGEKWGTDV